DEYAAIARRLEPAFITGKPVDRGGIVGREDATGRGGCCVLDEIEQLRGWRPERTTVAVQGFGNVGQHAAEILHQSGHRIVAVSDSRQGVWLADGLDLPQQIEHKR